MKDVNIYRFPPFTLERQQYAYSHCAVITMSVFRLSRRHGPDDDQLRLIHLLLERKVYNDVCRSKRPVTEEAQRIEETETYLHS